MQGLCLVETAELQGLAPIYFVEYIFDKLVGRKMAHGRPLLGGFQTYLSNATNERGYHWQITTYNLNRRILYKM